MNDDANADPTATLAALTKQLEAAQKAEAAKATQTSSTANSTSDAAPPSEQPALFGMTPGSLLVGLVLSTIGLGCVRYAKVVGQWLFAFVGAALFLLPFFVTDALWLTLSGAGVLGGALLLKRFVTF
jgi:hypothetical protein